MDSSSFDRKSSESHLIWNFKNDDGKYINLSGDSLSLTYPGKLYTTFEPFLKDIKLALDGLELYTLPKIKSIGLRYINQIDLEDDSNLEGLINQKLHSLSCDSDNENIIQSISRIEYNIGEFFFYFQYGLFNPKYPDYNSKKNFILDYECILKGTPDNLEDCLNEMNNIIYTKFESSIEDKLRIKMGGENQMVNSSDLNYMVLNDDCENHFFLEDYLQRNIKLNDYYDPFVLIYHFIISDILPNYDDLVKCTLFQTDEYGNHDNEYYIKFIGNLSYSEKKQIYKEILKKIKEYTANNLDFFDEFEEISIFLIR